jgi:hypothetical protein
MLSFKQFLIEDAAHKQIVNDLQQLGYHHIEKKPRGTAITIKITDGDRKQELDKVAQQFGGQIKLSSRSSIGVVHLPNGFTVTIKHLDARGSGGGSKNTDLTESAQCLYCAALWYRGKTDAESLNIAQKYADTTSKVNDMMGITDDWKESCELGARMLYRLYGSNNYIFHKGSKWVKALESHFKVLNKKEPNKIIGDINKWSPADIYLTTAKGMKINFKQAKTVNELNNIMLDAFERKDIIGVSLKKMSKQAKYTYFNIGKQDSNLKDYRFKDYTFGKREFFASQDAFLFFGASGQFQFRRFGSWQGEIKGAKAAGGKIGGGPVTKTIEFFTRKRLVPNTIKKLDKKHVDMMFKWYRELEKGKKLTKKEFVEELEKKDDYWQTSKFLSVQAVYHVVTSSNPTKLIQLILNYAGSQTPQSAPFLKLE